MADTVGGDHTPNKDFRGMLWELERGSDDPRASVYEYTHSAKGMAASSRQNLVKGSILGWVLELLSLACTAQFVVRSGGDADHQCVFVYIRIR